jgi:hypothetical protein
MGMFAETVFVDYRLSFADQEKKLPFSVHDNKVFWKENTILCFKKLLQKDQFCKKSGRRPEMCL